MVKLLNVLYSLLLITYNKDLASARKGRNLNGTQASLGQFSSQVQIRLKKDNLHKCGGTLIEDSHVLTAAVCVDGFDANALSVMAGDVSLYETTVSSRQFRDVNMIVIHPSYNKEKDKWAYNIAVLKLLSAFRENKNLEPITMVTEKPLIKTVCYTTEWGVGSIKDNAPKLSHVLYFSELYIVDVVACGRCTEKTLCAMSPTITQGNCQSDEGGGLYCNGYLRGVYAGSFNECTESGALFADMLELGPWIKRVLLWDGDGETPLPFPEGRRLPIRRNAANGSTFGYQFGAVALLKIVFLTIFMDGNPL